MLGDGPNCKIQNDIYSKVSLWPVQKIISRPSCINDASWTKLWFPFSCDLKNHILGFVVDWVSTETSCRVLSWLPKTRLKEMLEGGQRLEGSVCIMLFGGVFWGLPCFSCIKNATYSCNLVDLSERWNQFFFFTSLCCSWCLFELAACQPAFSSLRFVALKRTHSL